MLNRALLGDLHSCDLPDRHMESTQAASAQVAWFTSGRAIY